MGTTVPTLPARVRTDVATSPTPAVDRDTFASLLADHMRFVWWLARDLYERAYPRGQDRRVFDVEDLVQEIVAKAWEKMHRFDPERRPFKRWLGCIASLVSQTARDKSLSRKRETLTVSYHADNPQHEGDRTSLLNVIADPAAVDPSARLVAADDEAERRHERERVVQAVDQLPADMRGAVATFYGIGRPAVDHRGLGGNRSERVKARHIVLRGVAELRRVFDPKAAEAASAPHPQAAAVADLIRKAPEAFDCLTANQRETICAFYGIGRPRVRVRDLAAGRCHQAVYHTLKKGLRRLESQFGTLGPVGLN